MDYLIIVYCVDMKKQALIAKESKATAAAITANSNPNETNETHETFNVRI